MLRRLAKIFLVLTEGTPSLRKVPSTPPTRASYTTSTSGIEIIHRILVVVHGARRTRYGRTDVVLLMAGDGVVAQIALMRDVGLAQMAHVADDGVAWNGAHGAWVP